MNAIRNTAIQYRDLGSIAYAEAWELQRQYLQRVVDVKVANRDLPPHAQQPTENWLLFCEHPPVYTLGKSGKPEHLLLNEDELKAAGIEYFKTDRGGDITYHGPGQIVGYPIFDLENFFTDIARYLRTLEEAVIQTLAHYGLQGGRIAGLTGVWLDVGGAHPRKICALGVRCSRWVSMHGFAFNINTYLPHFGNIIPCGIADRDKGVTSLAAELGRTMNMEEVKNLLRDKILDCFEVHSTVGG
jgi:lipoyl(octanoyl) transferase